MRLSFCRSRAAGKGARPFLLGPGRPHFFLDMAYGSVGFFILQLGLASAFSGDMINIHPSFNAVRCDWERKLACD